MFTSSKAKTLIIDLNPSSGLGFLLRKMFDSSKNLLTHSYLNLSVPSDSDNLAQQLSLLPSLQNVDLIFMTMPLEIKAVPEALQTIKGERVSFPPVIAVFKDMIHEQAIELLKVGVVDFITPPFKTLDILPQIWRFIARKFAEDNLTHNLKEKLGLQQIVGKSRIFLSEIEKIPLIAKSNSTVLIAGETGTGKELFARAIHYLSLRAGHPFVPVNCGAMPVELVENELFGHRKGAYTGAHESRQGLLGQANGGTVFLDEIDCMPLPAQVKLLRFLQEKEYRQIGSLKTFRSDVRVIAATNSRLDLAAKEGMFRRDLYYRLNVIPLSLPPLRKRPEDIPLLVRHFLEKHAQENGRDIADISSGALRRLMVYDWPGNVRELENVIERAVVLSRKANISVTDIALPECREEGQIESFRDAKTKVVEQFEREYIQTLLLAHGGNISKASASAGKNRRAFWELIRKHEIDAREYRIGQQ